MMTTKTILKRLSTMAAITASFLAIALLMGLKLQVLIQPLPMIGIPALTWLIGIHHLGTRTATNELLGTLLGNLQTRHPFAKWSIQATHAFALAALMQALQNITRSEYLGHYIALALCTYIYGALFSALLTMPNNKHTPT